MMESPDYFDNGRSATFGHGDVWQVLRYSCGRIHLHCRTLGALPDVYDPCTLPSMRSQRRASLRGSHGTSFHAAGVKKARKRRRNGCARVSAPGGEIRVDAPPCMTKHRMRKELIQMHELCNETGVRAKWLGKDLRRVQVDCAMGEGLLVRLEVHLPLSYPYEALVVRCRSAGHPSVDSQGRLCYRQLLEQWSPAFTVATVLRSVGLATYSEWVPMTSLRDRSKLHDSELPRNKPLGSDSPGGKLHDGKFLESELFCGELHEGQLQAGNYLKKSSVAVQRASRGTLQVGGGDGVRCRETAASSAKLMETRRWRQFMKHCQVVDVGSRLGRWRQKCLQAAVCSLSLDPMSSRLRARFLLCCANHDASGLCGSLREAQNFVAVQDALRQENAYVWVVSAFSLGVFSLTRFT